MHSVQDDVEGAEPPQADAKIGKAAKKAAGKVSGKAATAAATSKAEKAAEQQRQAQLELLMMDDSALRDVARVGEGTVLLMCTFVLWLRYVARVSRLVYGARLKIFYSLLCVGSHPTSSR